MHHELDDERDTGSLPAPYPGESSDEVLTASCARN